MGLRGPKPQPAAVKKAKGNPGRRPLGADPELPADAETASASKVGAPAWLKGEAKTIWEKLAPRLIAMRLLTQTDAFSFARYCTNYAQWLGCQRRMKGRGMIYEIETASGKVRRADPSFMMADRLDRRLEAFEDRFGLNPAERQRIFAQRAAVPSLGDLFGSRAPAQGQSPAASTPATAAEADDAFDGGGPIGMLQ